MTPMTVDEALERSRELPGHISEKAAQAFRCELMRPHQRLLRMLEEGVLSDCDLLRPAHMPGHIALINWTEAVEWLIRTSAAGSYSGDTLDEAAQKVLDELEAHNASD